MHTKKRRAMHSWAIRKLAFSLMLMALLMSACTPPTPAPLPTLTPSPVPSSSPSPQPTEIPPSPTPSPTPQPSATPSPTPSPTQAALRYGKLHYPPATLNSSALTFATFTEKASDVEPALEPPPIAPDLSNVTNPFLLSDAQLQQLGRNGFVVSPGTEKEFFVLYEKARYAHMPVFVTSDSLLHVYHLLFDKFLRTAEINHFIPMLRTLNRGLLARTEHQYQQLQDPAWKEAARRTVAFVAVGRKLLDPDVKVPDYVEDLVAAELDLIEAADEIHDSPIFPQLPQGEDYTQYIPRGHYTLSDELTAYFKSMMWYGRMTFRLDARDPDIARRETRMALLLVHALRTTEIEGQPALELWANIYTPTVFFVGRSDDLTVIQYGELMDEIYGPEADLDDFATDAQLDTFMEAADQLPPPRILGMVIMEWEDEETVAKGMRFMGQRFVPDAYIFRQLIYTNVGVPGNARSLPNGLDVPAAMGSERAYAILDEMGETNYPNYDEQMAKMQAWTGNLSTAEWTETLYNTWLYNFYLLLEAPGAGAPASAGAPHFMQSPAWVDKQLNTVMGSWAELKHDTILYAKQAYSELGGAPEPPPPALPPRGYVEPVPKVYARLGALIRMTEKGLSNLGLLEDGRGDNPDKQQLQHLAYLVDTFQTIAEKELRGEPLTEEDYNTIRYYGGELEKLTAAASVPLDTQWPGDIMDEEPQAAVIADVATAPSPGLVLEVGVGRINELYAVVPLVEDDGTITLQVAKGGVFSYYEFPWPMSDRLTDEAWRQMIEEGTAPEPPAWSGSFFVPESGYTALHQAIFNVQESLVDAFWLVDASQLRGGEALRNDLTPELTALADAGQCQRRLLHSSQPRSIDLQSETLAVVTTRETWEDRLYGYEGGWCHGYDEEPFNQRGPYTLDATYTLELVGGDWRVTRVIYANEPPAWEE
jgi:hypothetical protein